MTLHSCGTFKVTHHRYIKHQKAQKGSSFRLHYFTSPLALCNNGNLRKLDSVAICRSHRKGCTFSSVIYRPRMLIWLGSEPATSRSADQHSPN